MSSLSAVLGNKGEKIEFEHGGKTWKVSYLTQAKKAAFEQWLKQQAMRAVFAAREFVAPDEYAEALREVSRDAASGTYYFHGEVARRALGTPAGSIALAAVLFGCPEEEMAGLVAARGDDVRAVMDAVVAESNAREGGRPNPEAGAAKG